MSVSVVIPTRDRPAALRRAVASALAQSHRPLEVIVVDDGERPASLFADPLVRVIRVAPPRGDPGAARNVGVAGARGEFVAFLDDDDAWHPAKLARQLAVVADAGATSCGFEVRDERGRLIERHVPRSDDLRHDLLMRPMLQPSALLVRRAALDRAGGFPEQWGRAEDWALFLRLADVATIVLQPEVLVTRARSPMAADEALAGIARVYAVEIAPRVRPAERAAVVAHHRLVAGVLLARMRRRRAAARLLWRSSARWQILRLLTGERCWAALRRVGRDGPSHDASLRRPAATRASARAGPR
jgi:glycosyltransferase involved in cell wall biosynthesis